MNEHIVATALYYLDSDNVTPTELSFRMATSADQTYIHSQVGDEKYEVYERIFGTVFHYHAGNESVQPYGSVATPEGRLLAFPNVL